jgi:hypothetical protein
VRARARVDARVTPLHLRALACRQVFVGICSFAVLITPPLHRRDVPQGHVPQSRTNRKIDRLSILSEMPISATSPKMVRLDHRISSYAKQGNDDVDFNEKH